MTENSHISVYVDGACRNNGHNNPLGGCGVYWGPYHPLNTYEKLCGTKQTNNRAELTAAILAGKQAQVIGIDKLQIITDSQYVKNGIEKWIGNWKQNGWKTGRRKTDVLNKDLWLQLDSITSGKNVIWRWVHAHSTEIGNVEADQLAKIGISCDDCYWQEQFKDLEITDQSIDSIQNLSLNSEEETSVKSVSEPENRENTAEICRLCDKQVMKGGINCMECKRWVHYTCTRLPAYQLYLYETTLRKFTCELCTELEEDFVLEFSKLKRHDEKTVKSIQTQTEKRQSDKLIQCSVEQTSSVAQTLDFHNPNLQTKDNTMQCMEKSFVQVIDKHLQDKTSVTEYKNEIQDLNLKRKIQSCSETSERQNPEISCKECSQKEDIIQKLKEEKMEFQNTNANRLLEHELEMHKLKMQVEILVEQLQINKQKLQIYMDEVATFEEKINLKNTAILDLEKQNTQQRRKIADLEDQVISWKLHNSRADDSLLLLDSFNSDKDAKYEICKKLASPINVKNATVDVTANKTSTEEMKPTQKVRGDKHDKDVPIQHKDIKTGYRNAGNKSQSTKVATTTNSSSLRKGHKVTIIGTSNTKFVNRNLLKNKRVEIDKVMKYTIDETKQYLYSSNSEKLSDSDAIFLHLLCNDLEQRSAEQCTAELIDIIDNIKGKCPKSKVIVSLGLPRKSNEFNRKVEKMNILIKEELHKRDQLATVCDNSNLFYRGRAAYGVLNSDKHLSRNGTFKFSANIRQTLREALQLNEYKDQHRVNDRNSYEVSRYNYQWGRRQSL